MNEMSEQTEKEFLDSYSAGDYERPSVTVDMLIFALGEKPSENYRKLPKKELRLLLIKRRAHPYKDFWAIPGGFVQPSETLDDAARRELFEETNLQDVYMEQLYTWGDPHRDPRTRVISTSYMALVSADHINKIIAGDDAIDAKWFTVTRGYTKMTWSTDANGQKKYSKTAVINFVADDGEKIEATLESKNAAGKLITGSDITSVSSELAFDHAVIINYALDRIESKVEWTNLVFNLMPRHFTLTELQRVYEVLLGRSLEKANFRRKIKGMVKPTNDFTREAGHRPAGLYEYNPDWNGGF